MGIQTVGSGFCMLVEMEYLVNFSQGVILITLSISVVKSSKVRLVGRVMASQSHLYPNLQSPWICYLHGKRDLKD